MNIKRIVPNITSVRLDERRAFYTEFFGFQVVMDWIITLASPTNPSAQISLDHGNQSGIEHQDMTVSIEADDVDGVHANAVSRVYPIRYPLTDEPWGIRRFHVSDPNGVLINILSHLE